MMLSCSGFSEILFSQCCSRIISRFRWVSLQAPHDGWFVDIPVYQSEDSEHSEVWLCLNIFAKAKMGPGDFSVPLRFSVRRSSSTRRHGLNSSVVKKNAQIYASSLEWYWALSLIPTLQRCQFFNFPNSHSFFRWIQCGAKGKLQHHPKNTGWWIQPTWKRWNVKMGSSSARYGVKIPNILNHHPKKQLFPNNPLTPPDRRGLFGFQSNPKRIGM